MTNAELLAKIKAEIERLKGIGGIVPLDNREQKTGYESALIDMETFLDSLESGKPMIFDEELNEEIKKEMVKLPFFIRGKDQIAYARHFAQWGAKWQKEQMMKYTVDATVHLEPGANPVIEIDVGRFGLKVKDKVKVIIVKEEN